MKIEYSKTADALYVYFREAEVSKSTEIQEGVVVDFDSDGNLVGIELLDASTRLGPRDLVNFSVENLPIETIEA